MAKRGYMYSIGSSLFVTLFIILFIFYLYFGYFLHNVRLPRGRPGFDSRPMHTFFLTT